MENLIERVRKHPCLWKYDVPEYKNNKFKEEAWRKVTKECSLPNVKEARSLWKKLRDSHRQAVRARKKPDTTTKWKYELQMEFLLPTMANRAQQTNKRSTDQEDSLLNEDSSLQSEKEQLEDGDSPYDLATENIKQEPEFITILTNEQKRRDRRSAERDALRKQIQDSSSRNVSSENSALEKFFMSMFETTISFPDRLQLRVQRQIFNLVMEAKEEHLDNTDNLIYS